MKFILNFGHFLVLILIIFFGVIAFFKADFIKIKSYSAQDFGIEILKSENDKDQDGIDDYQDIFEGALEFIKQKPRYKSKYYEGGYPTDEFAVCTDLIWFALKNAGYDLKSLIDEDILNNLEDYDIDNVDPNIDFRRVKNLEVFFKKYTENLTIDVLEIEKWQPGDIVIYKNHIAIISDKRNKEGIPFIIHHANSLKYEENALMKKEIIGHYRFNLNKN